MLENQQKALNELAKLPSTEDALIVLAAIEEKRKKHHYAKYWKATEKEAEALKKFTEAIKVFGILGGNRSGKTEIGAFVSVVWALGKDYFRNEPAWEYVKDLPVPDPPNNIWVVGLDFPVLKNVIWHEKLRYGREHAGFLPRDTAAVQKVTDSDFQVLFANRSILTGKSADSGREKFQGASIDLVWIDEETEADIFDECFQRTADCAGKILVTATPLVDISSGVRSPWIFDLYQDALAGKSDIAFSRLSVLDNPYVPEDEKTRLKEKWAGHFEERARLYGDFIHRSGLVYHMWDDAKHLEKPYKIPASWTKIVSIDPAATGITAALWAAIDSSNNIHLYKEYYEPNLVISEHAKNLLARNGGDVVDMWYIDPKFASQRNAETHKTNAQLYREAGIPVRIPQVGEDYGVNTSLEYMQAAITPLARHPRVYVFNDLACFIKEIKHYVWDSFQRGPLRGQVKEKPRKGNDHLMNAFQYLCAMRPRKQGYSIPELSEEQKRQRAQTNSYTSVLPFLFMWDLLWKMLTQ